MGNGIQTRILATEVLPSDFYAELERKEGAPISVGAEGEEGM